MSTQARDPAGDGPLRFLVGPTASGKSDLALAVAEAAGAQLLSLDSMLVYRGMDIGTAKPDAAMQARVPHHLMDLAGPEEEFNVQQWRTAALEALEQVAAAGERALFVGGTAFYLKALVYGLFDGPPVDPALRAELEQRARDLGPEALHAELAAVDAASAARLHPNDVRRVVRGLEVWHQTGRTLSDWQQEWGGHPTGQTGQPGQSGQSGQSQPDGKARGLPRRIVGLASETEGLDERIRRRTTAMLDAGWAEEARSIRAGPGFGATARQALGYAQVLRLVDGELEREVCEQEIALRTRQFARRQRTWLRKFSEIEWLEAPRPGEGSAAPERVEQALVALGLKD